MRRFRSKRIKIGLVAALAVAAGCAEATSPPVDASAPLFEVEVRNSVWDTRWTGFYVTAQGGVYSWDRSGMRDPDVVGTELTPEQLARKYAPRRRLVKTLTAAEVMQRFDLVSIAAAAGLADVKTACIDMSLQIFSAWRYDAADGRYHRVLLHQRGETGTTRLSDAGRTLWHWLDDLTREGPPFTGCDPYPD